MASNTRDPVQGLVDFVLDIKPYHTKIMQVLVEYVYFDQFVATFSEQLEMVIDLKSAPSHFAVCEDSGWAMYPWGLMNDDSDPFNIPGNPNSGYRTFQPFLSPTSVSYWDDTDDCIPRVGPWTVYAMITEELTFSPCDISFNDNITALVRDHTGVIDWDSTLKATTVLSFDTNTIYFNGNQTFAGLLGYVAPEDEPDTVIAIHGSEVNDGTYTVLSSSFDPIGYQTAVVVDNITSFATSPQFLLDAGVAGRAVDANSPYYWPQYGYELPVIRTESTPITGDPLDGLFKVIGSGPALPYQLNQVVFLSSTGTFPTITTGDRYSSQIIDITASGNLTQYNSTGLDDSSRQYSITVSTNGYSTLVSVIGSQNQTYQQLLQTLNTQLAGIATVQMLSNGNIKFTAVDNLTSELIDVQDYSLGSPPSPLFDSLNDNGSVVLVDFYIAKPTQTRMLNSRTGYYYIPISDTEFRLTEKVDGASRGVTLSGSGNLTILPAYPLDPMGWGSDPWGGGFTGPSIGASISSSWLITVDPTTDLFTLVFPIGSPQNIPDWQLGDEVYLTGLGSLPDMMLLDRQVPISREQIYYFIPVSSSLSQITFRLSYSPIGSPIVPIDVVNTGSGDLYIGNGEHINFLSIQLSTVDTPVVETVTAPLLVPIFDIDYLNEAFIVQGDYTQYNTPGSTFLIQGSWSRTGSPLGSPMGSPYGPMGSPMGSPYDVGSPLGSPTGSPNDFAGNHNNGWWNVAGSPTMTYDSGLDLTYIYVTDVINVVNFMGYIQLPWGSNLQAPVITSITETLEIVITYP